MHVTFDELDRSLIGLKGPDRVNVGIYESDSINVHCAVSEGMDMYSEGWTGLEYMDERGMESGVMSGTIEGFAAADTLVEPERFPIRRLNKDDPPGPSFDHLNQTYPWKGLMKAFFKALGMRGHIPPEEWTLATGFWKFISQELTITRGFDL